MAGLLTRSATSSAPAQLARLPKWCTRRRLTLRHTCRWHTRQLVRRCTSDGRACVVARSMAQLARAVRSVTRAAACMTVAHSTATLRLRGGSLAGGSLDGDAHRDIDALGSDASRGALDSANLMVRLAWCCVGRGCYRPRKRWRFWTWIHPRRGDCPTTAVWTPETRLMSHRAYLISPTCTATARPARGRAQV